MIKKYTKGNLTVVWKPDLCIHSANCIRGLPDVFDNRKKPWVNLDGAGKDRIIEQVRACPSGALSFVLEDEMTDPPIESENAPIRIVAIQNGPLMVASDCEVQTGSGDIQLKTGKVFFCRCGHSAKKPFCDGSHKRVGFHDDSL